MNEYVVINRSAAGNLVVVVVKAYSAQNAVNKRAAVLQTGGHRCEIVAVSESVPGPWGTGGRVLRAVKTPPKPDFVATDEKLSSL